MNEEKHLEMLIQSIQLLAAEYEVQTHSFPDFVHIPDELALTYGDCFLLADQLEKTGLINELQMTSLKKLEKALEMMSTDEKKALWTLDALKNSFEWENIRAIANRLLVYFGEQRESPNLSWIEYVKVDSQK